MIQLIQQVGDSGAKITDFGMARAFTAFSNTVTKVPGTEVYMPPEAFQEKPPKYRDKFDCFAFGVLVIQILTCQYPNPSEKMNKLSMQGVVSKGIGM